VLDLLDRDTATEYENRPETDRLAIVKHLEWVATRSPDNAVSTAQPSAASAPTATSACAARSSTSHGATS
jgi:hypothetical protein